MAAALSAPGDLASLLSLPQELAGYPFPEEFADLLARHLPAGRASVGMLAGVDALRFPAFVLSHGYNVFAVEADPDRRASCQLLQRYFPDFQVVSGELSATGLPAASVDFIVSDRALHAPDLAATRTEFRRILRPGGTVALVTDNRVYTGSAQSEAFTELLRIHCPGFREREPSRIGPAVAALFDGGTVFEDAFTGHQDLSLNQFLYGVRSLPIYPGNDRRPDHATDLAMRRFFAHWSSHGQLHIPTVCRIAIGRLS